MSQIDRYLLRLAFWPLVGATGVTLVALLLERVLRLLDLLSNSSDRFGFVAQLAVNLVPHYVGLTLPAAFFIALVLVVNRMNQGSEIDALLAAGVSLTRIAAPFLCLAVALAAVSLIVFGFLQPYSRYAYRAVLHAAQNAGWSGAVPEGTIIAPNDNLTMTTDEADTAGQRLTRVFIRRVTPAGREEVTTAGMAEISRTTDGKNVQLLLKDGQQLRFNDRGEPQLLAFKTFTMQLPLTVHAAIPVDLEATYSQAAADASVWRTAIPASTCRAVSRTCARCVTADRVPGSWRTSMARSLTSVLHRWAGRAAARLSAGAPRPGT